MSDQPKSLDENTPPDDVVDNILTGEETDVEISKNQEPVLDEDGEG